jgi:hypothetical protein
VVKDQEIEVMATGMILSNGLAFLLTDVGINTLNNI